MLTERQGDCFNYYGLTKVMLDQLGIPNIDVRKVKNYDEIKSCCTPIYPSIGEV
jgi:hypothetical protein